MKISVYPTNPTFGLFTVECDSVQLESRTDLVMFRNADDAVVASFNKYEIIGWQVIGA